MPTKHVRTVTLYTFDELSDAAKKTARAWMRDTNDECPEFWGSDSVIEDANTCARILGIEFDSHPVKLGNGATTNEPTVYWSGFGSQGDGASFNGAYRHATDAPARIREHAPQDETLHDIADRLHAIQYRLGHSLAARIWQSGHYSHSGSMRIESIETEDGEDVPESVGAALRDELRAFADWIYQQLESAYEYAQSDEAIDEAVTLNEYTFDESGKRED